MDIFAQLVFIVLHGPGGHEILLNPNEVVSLYRIPENDKYFTEAATCRINTTDGKFITVVEACEEVNRAIQQRLK